MRIEELSIGDWVKYKEREWQVFSLDKFTGEVGLWRKDSQLTEDVTYIEPIPLTPEILEKSGFVYVGGGVFSYGKVDLFYEDGKLYFAREAGYDKLLHIEHTHQLQHALRLAGIDKEIEV